MCMQRVTGSILSRCKDDWQVFFLLHFVAQCGSMFGLRTAKGLSRRFQHGSGMNLIKQMEIVTGRRCVWLFSSMV